MIGKQHFGPKLKNQNFVIHGIGVEISITTLFFVLDYIHEKLMTKFFKNSRNLNLGPFSKFSKKALSVFTYSNYLPSCKKNYPLFTHSLTDRQTDKQTDNGDFIGYSTGLGSNSYNKMYYYKGSRNA